MKIAYQGTKGSFSHQTIKNLASETLGLATFKEVYEAVEKGDSDLGLLPIENSLAGCIYETIDLLSQGDLFIVCELITKVEHHLMGLTNAQIEKVISHPKALAQCTKFFEENPKIDHSPFFDTAGAAEEVALKMDPKIGAIASREAANIYGLKILSENIQDERENFTRFLLISKKKTTGTKCSLVFSIPHEPGSLAKTLKVFHSHGIDLTSIISRPIKNKPFEYLFFVDIVLKKGQEIPKLNVRTLKNLGSYEAVSNCVNC